MFCHTVQKRTARLGHLLTARVPPHSCDIECRRRRRHRRRNNSSKAKENAFRISNNLSLLKTFGRVVGRRVFAALAHMPDTRVLSIECLINSASPIKSCKAQRARGVHIKKIRRKVESKLFEYNPDFPGLCPRTFAYTFFPTPSPSPSRVLQFYLALKFRARRRCRLGVGRGGWRGETFLASNENKLPALRGTVGEKVLLVKTRSGNTRP